MSGPADYRTPPEIFEPCHWRFDFDFDAAADERNHLLPEWSGHSLGRPWGQRSWCNPPFSRGVIDQFAEKAAYEGQAGRRVWMLVRGDWSTDWWRTLWMASSRLWLVTPRIRFIAPDGTPTRSVDRNPYAIFEVDGDGPVRSQNLWNWRAGERP